MKHHISSHSFSVLMLLLLASTTESCSWNDDEFKTFALDGNVYTCHGICDIGNDVVNKEDCLAIKARWVEKENTAYCSIETEEQCRTLANRELLPNTARDPEKIHWYAFSGSDLGNGRYIIQYTHQSLDHDPDDVAYYYVCGSFDYVRDTSHRSLNPEDTTCTREEIAEFKRLASMHLCHNSTPYCVPQTSGTPKLSGPDNLPVLDNAITVAICSECSPGQASCSIDGTSYSTKCVDLRSDVEHCGTCGTHCGENEICKDGACTKRVCDKDNWCEQYKVCIDEKSRETCGIKTCEEYGRRITQDNKDPEEIACPRYSECVSIDNGLNYECRCSGESSDQSLFVKYYNRATKFYACYLKSSPEHCGATEKYPGDNCVDAGSRCQADDLSNPYQSTYSCHECENNGFYCPQLNPDACIDPRTNDQYCGLTKDCKSYTTCNTTIGEECRDSKCQCPVGKLMCEVDGVFQCIDPQNSPTHCGASGTCKGDTRGNANFEGDNCAAAELSCQNGRCQCPGSEAFCGGRCINPFTDAMYCGVDRDTCQAEDSNAYTGNCMRYNGITSQAQAKCMAGHCSCATSGFSIVQVYRNNANDEFIYQCVDSKSDYAYCDACVSNKNGPNCNGRGGCKDGAKCVDGACVESTLKCNKNEVACHSIEKCYDASIYHVNASCTACERGYCSVTNNPLDGCFLSADQLHLSQDCQACAPGFCDTNHVLTDGCPLDQKLLHLNTTCDGCAEGWADSDHELMNGCDIDLNADPLNCGQLGNNCYDVFYGKSAISPANGDIACVNGECVVPVCDANYLNCDTTPGCETDRRYDNKHCGRCNHACQANAKACVNGECKSCVASDWQYENAYLLPCCDGKRYFCQTVSGEFHFYACGSAAFGYECTLIENNPNLH